MRAAPLLLLLAACSSFGVATGRFPGRVEEVSFHNGAVRLAGIGVTPYAGGPFPAVVFIHGSGPSTYDSIAWRAHAEAFVARGFAVLVYDKRGSRKSGGNLATADYGDLADDVAAGVRFLRARG